MVTVTRPDRLLSEAQRVLATFDLDLADSLATSARHLDGGWAADQVLAEVLLRRGRYEDAAAALPRRPPGSAPAGQHIRWAVAAAAIHYWGAGDIAAAEQVLGEVGGPIAEAHRAGFVLLDGRPHAALAGAEQVLHDRYVPDEAIIPAAATVAIAASLTGRSDRAMAAIERTGVARMAVAQLGFCHCFALLMAGRVAEASRMAEDGHRDAVAAENVAVTGGWSTLCGLVAKARGDLASAVAALSSAARLIEGHDPCRMLVPCLAELAAAYAMSGDCVQAEHTLQHAASQAHTDRLFTPWLDLSRAWATAAGGDTVLAARQATAAADTAAAAGKFALEAVARYDVARLGDPKAVQHRLAQLADMTQGPLVPAMAGAAAALASSDADALSRATAAFAELGLDLLAAETASAAHHRRGRTLPVNRPAACPEAATPLLRLTTALTLLTRRERDIALLAATGLTSQTMGDRLRLSARTIDNSLGRIYQKLGVTSRRDLVPLVTPGQ